ncbi:MAG: extracellular solute-binding protein, partial [Chloroflexota bacterium]
MAKSIGRYEIRSELGRGGMAAVYRALDPKLDREVALKLMDQQLSADPAFAARFEREAKTVAGLEHGAIVSLYDYGEADGWLYLVMRYMEGGTLREQIARGSLAAGQTYDVVRRIGSALDKAHSKGIIHRDLKPANILLDEEGEPYLSDFGIVKVAKGDTEYLTETGQTLGTFAYMSPEQVVGQELTGRSDLYTLGIVLYEMLTGKHPFGEASTSGAMAIAHAQQAVPDVTEDNPAVSAALNDVVRKAMAKEPDDRYASGREMTLALYEALTGKPAAAAASGMAAAGVAASAAAKKTPVVRAEAEKATTPAAVEKPAKQEPAPAGQQVQQQPAPTPAAQPASEAAVNGKRKIPVWVFVAAGVIVVVGIAIAAVVGLDILGGNGDDTAEVEVPAEEAEVEVPAEEPAEEMEVEALAEEEPAPEEVEVEAPSIAGETVTILTFLAEDGVAYFEDSLRPFEEQTGVEVIVEGVENLEAEVRARAAAGDPADIYLLWPTLLFDLARDGQLVDLNQFLDDGFLHQQYDQSWLDMGMVDGTLVGLWREANVFSLVWYPPRAFEELGFDRPRDWDELLAITEILAIEGRTPWCIGIESSAASGWPGTYWIEDILLRTAGPERYDQWVAGELPFSSPEVRTAFEIMGQIWLEPAFVHGGTEAINGTSFIDAPIPMIETP